MILTFHVPSIGRGYVISIVYGPDKLLKNVKKWKVQARRH